MYASSQTHRFFYSLALLIAIVVALPSTAFAAARAPNVVMIVADDLGWADLGCYGSKFHKTPQLDQLASSGRRFTQAYAACPVCSPTRLALTTGKHPARLNLTDWLPGRPDRSDQPLCRPVIRQELPLEEITLAERLKAAGYATGHIGKWHLGGEGYEPTRQGFDLNIAGDHTGTPLSYFAPYSRGGRTMPGLETASDGEYLTDRLAHEAEKFIEANRERPFFLYLPHYAVHTPLKGKEELVAQFPKWDGTPHGKQENPIYAAMLFSLDEAVGRVVRKLDALGLRENTIIIFTSDNGGLATNEGANTPATINSPLREGKGWLYEGGLRVPLIIAGAGVTTRGDEATPVWSADLVPTIAELCGVKISEPLDGVSIASVLQGVAPLAPRALYWHYPHYANQGSRPGAAIRDGDWKLIEFYDSSRRELYEVGKQVNESSNQAPRQPEKVAELAAKLADWRKAVNAQMPTPNPDYVPSPPAADGTITLRAAQANIEGHTLRYEPLPHKNTLGFWTQPSDWAHWDFTVRQPGEYAVEALTGCGKGSGGSAVEFRIGEQVLPLTVPETGGFQKFEPQALGRVRFTAPGRYRLEVRVRNKPGPAVMDLRQVTLKPVQ